MKSFSLLLTLIAAALASTAAFAPVAKNVAVGQAIQPILKMGVFEEQERTALTRDSEPEDYFQTNTDKMSDEDKLPIALAGLLGISLPFILGLIALYSAK